MTKVYHRFVGLSYSGLPKCAVVVCSCLRRCRLPFHTPTPVSNSKLWRRRISALCAKFSLNCSSVRFILVASYQTRKMKKVTLRTYVYPQPTDALFANVAYALSFFFAVVTSLAIAGVHINNSAPACVVPPHCAYAQTRRDLWVVLL